MADRKIVLSQSQAFDSAHPSDAKYVENVMWEQSKVVFVTIDPGAHAPQSSNAFGPFRWTEVVP